MTTIDLRARYTSQIPALSAKPASLADWMKLFVAMGDLLRRRASLGVSPESLEGALRSIPAPESVKPPFEVEDVGREITRAAEEAAEAGLDDAATVGETRIEGLMAALRMRDTLSSFLAGVERWVTLVTGSNGSSAESRRRLSSRLVESDRVIRTKARWLVSANEQRRAERDLLDPQLRDAAWWFSYRADCDDLLRVLAGREPGPHLLTCEDCRRDLSISRALESHAERHVTSDELWAYDSGDVGEAERERILRHARKCAACATALRALAEGEEVIAEASSAADRAAAPTLRARRREVVAEGAGFRVLVYRGPRLRLVVQPTRPGAVASASAMGPGGRGPVEPKPSAEGIEFDLGNDGSVTGRAVRIVVQLSDGSPPVEREITL